MAPILIDKDVSETSYKNLKLKVWNRNYFSTNLICLCLLNKLNYMKNLLFLKSLK